MRMSIIAASRLRGNPFVMVVDTSKAGSASDAFQFTGAVGDYDVVAKQGGVAVQTFSNLSDEQTITFSNGTGVYTLEVTPKATNGFNQIRFNNGGDKLKLTDIKSFGNIAWSSFDSAFLGSTNLTGTFTDVPNLTNVNNLFKVFREASVFNGDISNWDVSNVTNMSNSFTSSSLFNSDISNWDVSNVNSMQSMFLGATSFNSDISNWDVGNVTDMLNTFFSANSFDQDISSWNIINVTRFTNFLGASTLSTVNYDALLIGWEATLQATYPNGSGYTPNISFSGGNSQYSYGVAADTARQSLINNFNWTIADGGAVANPFIMEVDTSKSGSASDAFQFTGALGDYDVVAKQSGVAVETFSNLSGAQTITFSNGTGIYTLEVTPKATNGFNRINFSDLGDKLKLIDIKAFGNIAWSTLATSFLGCSNLTGTFTDTPNLSSTNDLLQTFRNCTLFNGDLSNWNVSNATNMVNLFLAASSFNSDISNWDISNVTSLQNTFLGASSFDQDLSSWDIINVTNFGNFLSGANLSTANYDALLIGWEATLQATYPNGAGYTPTISFTAGGSKYSYGVAADTARQSLINNFNWTITDGGAVANPFIMEVDTSKAGSASNAFQFTGAVGDYDVVAKQSGVAVQTFSNLSGQQTITFSNGTGIYTLEVTPKPTGGFNRIRFNNGGDKAKLIDIKSFGNIAWSSFDTAFVGCSNLIGTFTDVPNLLNVTNLLQTFRGTSLFNGDISSWNVSNVTTMSFMFFQTGLFNQDIGSWDVSNVTNMSSTFLQAPSFDQNLENWNIINVTSFSSFLSGVTLSTVNYDALLIGWEATLQATYPNGSGYTPTISFSGGNSQFTSGGAAQTARTSLINNFSWTIADGGAV
jgi:surface protein